MPSHITVHCFALVFETGDKKHPFDACLELQFFSIANKRLPIFKLLTQTHTYKAQLAKWIIFFSKTEFVKYIRTLHFKIEHIFLCTH